MPPYIEFPEDRQFPPPYDLRGITLRSFEVAATIGSLQLLCDEQLNIGALETRGRYFQPVSNFVAIEVLTYDRMSSSNPLFANKGYVEQRELYVRIPVWEYVLIGEFLVRIAVRHFFPFIFVDNFSSAVSGREVLGMGKILSEINQNTAGGNYQADLTVPAFKTLGPNVKEQPEHILGITCGQPAEILPIVNWPWSAFTAGGILPSEIQYTIVAGQMIIPNAFATLQLKQFRDAEDPSQACYQALVSGDFQVSNVQLPRSLPNAAISVSSCANLDLIGRLGLPAAMPLKPILAYELDFDMTYSQLTNLFVNQ